MSDLLLVEKVARALYQCEKERSECWQAFYADAAAAIAAIDAHRPPVTVASLYGYEAGLVEGARAQWQPIETAPKDDNWVILTGGKVEYGWCGETVPACVVGQRAGNAGWQFAWYDSGHYGEYLAPTHWMPLPSHPSIADDGKEGAG